MAEWRVRGYVQDSDEEEDSRNSILTGLTAPREVENIDETGTIELGDPDDVEAHDRRDRIGGLQVESERKGPGATNAREKCSSSAMLLVQREKEKESSPAVGQDGHDTDDVLVDTHEDIDELQQDHYKATPTAQSVNKMLSRTYDQEARPTINPLQPIDFPFSNPLSSSSSSPPEALGIGDETLSTPGTQRSARGDQISDRESSEDCGPRALEPTTGGNSTNDSEALVVNPAHEAQRAVRNLRHRNPIQLHPYAVESEQYKQTLKARGLKPLRIAQMEAEAARVREQEDSQNLEFNGEEDQLLDIDTEQLAAYSSSPGYRHDSPIVLSQEKRDIFVFGDDDLPDMSTLLSHSTLKYVGNGHKRRKTAKATSTTFRMPQGLDMSWEKSLPGDEAISILTDDDVLTDGPPSPPRSGSHRPLKTGRSAFPAFRMPRRPSTTALPTPITSSEPRRRHLLETSEDDQSDHQPLRIERMADTDDSTSGEMSPSEQESSHQLQRAQRKIRGVLPASWLKLDLKTQKKKPADTHKALPSVSPERNTAQRGVARMVSGPGGKSSSTPKTIHEIESLSDDEGPASEADEMQHQSPFHQRQHYMLEDDREEALFTGRQGEAFEDDQIDPMLPSAKRAFHTRKRGKRQTKIGDFHTRSEVMSHEISKNAPSNGAHQRKIMDQIERGHKEQHTFRPPRIGILDVPLMRGSPQDSVPQFLMVASRTARSRNDKGRHSPSQKFVRLSTRADDNDANETLRHWREGTLVSLVNDGISQVSSRQPLHPRSANSRVPPKAFETKRIPQESTSIRSRMPSAKPHVRPIKSRKAQTSLDSLIERRHLNDPDAHRTKSPSWLQQAVEKPKKPGQIVSSLRANKDSRPAMLESAREDADQTQATFHRDLARVNHFDNDAGLPGVVVRRFLGEDGMRPVNAAAPQGDHRMSSQDAMKISALTRRVIPHKRRKRQPKRLIIPEVWPGEPSAPIILDEYPDRAVNSCKEHKRDMLAGLGRFGTQYSATFNVTPLPTGTYFSTSTLLGSGAFAKALKFAVTANLEGSRGYAFVRFKDRSLRWGPWNDAVSSELGEVFEAINHSLQDAVGQTLEGLSIQTYEEILLLQNSTLEYFSNHLSFLDPVDRVAYVLRCKGLLFTLVAELINRSAVRQGTIQQAPGDLQKDLQFGTLTLSLTNQLRQISKHELIPLKLQDEISSLVQKLTHHTLSLSLAEGLERFETCLSKLRSRTADYRIQDHSIEAFVVAQHVLSQDPDSKTGIWAILLDAVPATSSHGVFDITLAEQVWKQLFTLLPFLELDAQGVVETGRRFRVSNDNWTLAKRLISPVLKASQSNPRGQPPSFNSYCRAIFGRCLHLINGWGWRRCEPIIGMLFDYYARNSLAHLRSEESNGSPLFLERLDENPTLTFEPEDRGFHILLKIIGSGLRHMRQSHPEKKLRDVVWRLMPNHGRSHPKEEAIRQEHLDALRNHHDLLCTLYWASPPSCRPRLTVIRNLVNLETSHREACHINIRAWFNLVKFQLSTDEPIVNLEPFAEWHNHLLGQIIRQHSLARTEAEDQVKSAQSVGDLNISEDMLETTISRNQRQVEAVLSDALVCLKLAIDAAQNAKAASTLLSTALPKVFDLFDTSRTQANKSIIQALDVLAACANKFSGSRDENEESQDYGDWSAFDDDTTNIPQQEDSASPFDTFQEPLRHLLWNCFGADLVPNDALLLKLVDVWVVVAQLLVRTGLRSWADYLGRFGNDSWSSLRDTEQTRKFSVYYLATLIERDSRVYHEHKAFFLMSWVSSLVERESLLRFQHRLMSALLNMDSENLLLQNLPFWRDSAKGQYQIAASDFTDRRLSLISSVLSNMRLSLEGAVFEPSVAGNELRQEFRDLLKHLMATMKRNYQELGPGSNVKGAYVDFVHRVIEFLQQHTSTICPIDRFFTDNGAFPLPATDPTYVVGQLKNYGLRLQDTRTPKQLVVFLQSVSERAALDGQQPYLVGQLRTAMSNSFEDGDSSTLTLRTFLVKNIVPAYIEMAFSTACGWVLAIPYLQALQEVFGELLKDLDGANLGSVEAIASTIAAFLESTREPLETLIGCSDESSSRNARTLRSISECYSAISALLPILDYIVRLPGPISFAVDNIEFFKNFAVYFSGLLNCDYDVDVPNINRSVRTLAETSISETRRFATQELTDTLNRTWVCHDDQYYIIRGSTRREVVVDIGLYEEEKMQLLAVFQVFFTICSKMPALREEDDCILARREKKRLGFDELFF